MTTPGQPRPWTRLARALAACTTVVLAGLAVPTVAHAAEQPVQLSAKPVGQPGQYFDLTLAPGQTRDLKIALGNHGTRPIAVRTYAADAYTIINGGFGAELRDGTVAGTTTWLGYPTKVLTLQPDRASVQTFSVTVPEGAPPGEYIAGVILENDDPIKGTGGIALDQVVRQAVAVAIRVPGPLTPGLSIGAASHKVAAERSVVAVDVSNTGNVRLTPKAKFVVHDDTGTVVSRATVPMDSFYAGTDTKVEITLATALKPGQYTVDLTLDDNPRNAHAAATGLPLSVTEPAAATNAKPSVGQQVIDVLQTRPEGLPRWAVIVLVVALALAPVILVVARRRRRRSHQRPGGRGHRRATRAGQPSEPQAVEQTPRAASGQSVLPQPAARGVHGRRPGSRRAPKHGGKRRIGV